MYGGGQWTSQNKILGGAYINFISASRVTTNLSDRGVASMPFELDWGADNVMMEVSQRDFQKNSLKLFGYAYTSAKMQPLRELFTHAVKAYIYKLTSAGVKASNTYATARYCGIRGNDLKVVIVSNVDDESAFDVNLYLETQLVDTQTVTTAEQLQDNDWVTWVKSATLEATAGMPLAGGENGAVTGDAHQKYLDLLEPYAVNAIGVCTSDATTEKLYAAYAKRMREKVGSKFQAVLYNCAADHEGVINVKNCVDVVPWTVGLEAACAVNSSCTNVLYDGELTIDTSYTQEQLEKAISAGEFVLHSVGSEVRVLEDINSLVTLTEDKNELFQSNQTIRVLDQIAMDIASLFNTKYHGKVQNNVSGRVSLWNDIVAHHKQLEKIGAIEDFSEDDVAVSAGTEKRGVYIEDRVTIVNAMSQLYMTVVIE